MKYGVVLGKHLDISRAEIFAQGLQIEKHYEQVAVFSDDQKIDENMLSALGGIVKRGQVIKTESIPTSDLVWVSNRELGTFLKKRGICKRYKDFDPLHTDEEVKNKWEEYIALDKDFLFVLEVQGYQDISRFSCIDYDKAVTSMQIGMMPAKLTQILVNIATGKSGFPLWKKQLEWTERAPITVYDPFMGLGTTYMIANSMGYNVIWSDINITPAKQNLPRWEKQTYYKKLPLTLFQHDVTQSLSKPFLKYINCIVTEGWLGHIVTAKTKTPEIEQYSHEIEKLYKAWINNMHPIREHMIIVCTIPWHTSGDNKHVTNILRHCESKGIRVETVPQVYTRSGQKVGRKIVTLSW